MNNRNLLIVAVALIAAIVGWVLSSDNSTNSFESEAMFVDLQKQLNEVDTIQVESSEGVVLKASKSDEQWVAANKQDYPLEKDDVVQLLNALATAQLNDAKTAKPENYVRLGLRDIAQQDSQASLVTLKAGEISWKILVGNTSASGNGLFVRKPEQMQSWLTRTMLDLPTDENDWLQTQILDIAASSVTAIRKQEDWVLTQTVTTVSDNPEQPLDSEDVASWQLSEMPDGRELTYDSVLQNTAEDILTIRFESLKQLRPMEKDGMNLHSVTVVETSDMGKVKISLFKQVDTWYALYDAPELLQPSSDYHWQKWVYELSDFHAGRLTKTLEDFLTELPEEESE